MSEMYTIGNEIGRGMHMNHYFRLGSCYVKSKKMSKIDETLDVGLC